MQNPKFQIFSGANGQYYFRLLARNGQNILSSEGYEGKSGCRNGIESVKRNAVVDARFERKTATSGQFFFVLTAANHETLGRSEMYERKENREKGIAAVKRVAPEAPVEDLTA